MGRSCGAVGRAVEIRGSNPNIGNEINRTYLSVNCYHKNKEKEAGNGTVKNA